MGTIGSRSRTESAVILVPGLVILIILLLGPRPARSADFWQFWPPAANQVASLHFADHGKEQPSILVGVGSPAVFSLHAGKHYGKLPEAGVFFHRGIGDRASVDFALGISRPDAFEGHIPLPVVRSFLRLGVIF